MVSVEIGDETFVATASVVRGEERDRLLELMKASAPNLDDFEQRSGRVIPVVVLEGVPMPVAVS